MSDKYGNKTDPEEAWGKAWPPLLLLIVVFSLTFWFIADHEERMNPQEHKVPRW